MINRESNQRNAQPSSLISFFRGWNPMIIIVYLFVTFVFFILIFSLWVPPFVFEVGSAMLLSWIYTPKIVQKLKK
tara:strand:+ start:161 stop:385 length:225 start_codon:yes stop_codon:yes gene_type:complete